MKKDINVPPNNGYILAEVWGDIVDLRHLAHSILIGGVISLSAYFVASKLLQFVVGTQALAHAYAMLVGLVACISSGAICAILFKPKRIVSENHVENDGWREIIQSLALERGGFGDIALLPKQIQQELKEIDLYDLFVEQETSCQRQR